MNEYPPVRGGGTTAAAAAAAGGGENPSDTAAAGGELLGDVSALNVHENADVSVNGRELYLPFRGGVGGCESGGVELIAKKSMPGAIGMRMRDYNYRGRRR